MGVKVSNLPTRTSPTAGDFIPITDNNGVMYKIPTADLADYLALLAGSGGGDITRPFVLGAVVTSASPGVVQVTFSESVPTLSVAGWSFKKGGTAWGVSSVSQTASTVWAFTMVSNASSGDALLMSYSQASGNTLDTAGNELTGFTDVSVTNNISGGGDVTAPTVTSRTIVASDKIRVVYSEAVNASTAGHVFTIDGGSFVPTSATSYTSTTVDYLVATTMTSGSTATHTYTTQGTGSGTRDAALNQLGAFSAQSVTNGLSSGGATWTKKANTTITANVGGFWEYKPSTYTPSGTKVPAIIAFHGGGAQGTGSSTDLNLLLNEGVPQQINAEGFSYQALVICPQYTGGAPSSAVIEAVIDYVLANYNVEPTKIHLTGLSFGGAILGNWAVAGTISKVASISVLCSYFDVNSTAVSRLKAAGMPIRLYHGDADSVAPVTNSRNWFNSLNATTSIVPTAEKYEIVGAEHNIWTDVYPSSAVFGGKNWAQWHLEQQRAAYDSDAQAFFTAASITDSTQRNAVNTFVVAAKANGYWSKLRRVFPFVGGDAAKHAYDLKTASSVITWAGALTHNANGVESTIEAAPSTSTGWGNTGFNLNTLTNNSYGFHMYRRDNADHGNQYQMGAFTGNNWYIMQTKDSGNFEAFMGGDGSAAIGVTTANSDSRGFYSLVRSSITVLKAYKNGSQIGSTNTTTNAEALPNGNVYLFGLNNIGTGISLTCPTACAFTAISDGLTDTEAANMYTDVQAMQTALSRSV